MQWYKESKKRFDEDPEFKKRAQLQVVKLQSGDPEARAAWEAICAISRKAFLEIYSLLDVKIVERGESFYNPYLAEIVDELDKRGLIALSDGAKCIFLQGFVTREGTPLPMIVQKSDGGYNYDTTDMAAMRHRIQVERADRIIILTDAGQSLHFAMLGQAAEKAGYLDPAKVRFDHVPFGVVLGPDGKKFKTRSGETEKLIDLLFEAIDHAKKIMQERLSDLSEQELNRSARILGIDAIKYADLCCHRIKDYVFSYDRMLKLEGNTAAFLLYAYVRIQGIKRKVNKEISAVIKRVTLVLEHPAEIALALHLRQFGEILDAMTKDLAPNRLCDYLYELAEKFHAFFRDCRVEGSPQEESRLALCEAACRVLEKGLNLLGLKTLDRM
jgi:arginyl-tRNA synthetase